ncbi:MAG: bifunctional DNA primase/polymerase [Nannocystaceae bacterium]
MRKLTHPHSPGSSACGEHPNPFDVHDASIDARNLAREELSRAARWLRSSPSLSPLPICRPTANGNCTASWHTKPCMSAGKHPLIKGYGQLAYQPADDWVINVWAQKFAPCNLAGVVRPGYIVIECDSAEAEAEMLALDPRLSGLGPCRERRPTRGRAWVLAVDPRVTFRSRSRLGSSGAIDVIAPCKPFVVEPSVHVTGHRVRWVDGRAPWGVPALTVNAAVTGLIIPASAPPAPPGASNPGFRSSGSGQPPGMRPIPLRVQFLLRYDSAIRNAWAHHAKTRRNRSASGYDMTLACLLLHRGVAPGVVVDALLACPNASRHDEAYARMTVTTALAAIGRTRWQRWG